MFFVPLCERVFTFVRTLVFRHRVGATVLAILRGRELVSARNFLPEAGNRADFSLRRAKRIKYLSRVKKMSVKMSAA